MWERVFRVRRRPSLATVTGAAVSAREGARAGMAHEGRYENRKAGTTYAVTGQLIWGTQPLFWPLLDAMDTDAIVAHRVVWSFVVAGLFAAALRGSRADTVRLLRSPADMRSLAVGGVLLGSSWAVYVYAVVSGRVVEASLALLIGPIAGALLGVGLLRERLSGPQWCACALAVPALAVVTVGYGHVPWLAFAIAGTVAAYGLVRKRRPVPAVAGTAIELAVLCPVGVAVILCGGTRAFGGVSPVALLVLLPAAGLITAVPSLLRVAALGRIPLSMFGLLGYLNPVIQLSIGVGVRGEPMSAASWVGFALVCCALAVFSADALRGRRATRTTAPARVRARRQPVE
ncbi:EamA family transporter RarD [Yinghuangia aomiensis]|uniref:EamA family transporter RarD n=1 Tax=Yinghuangia aomiensis TaxID=676205 RepID=A0ABP9HZ96_9ACTN